MLVSSAFIVGTNRAQRRPLNARLSNRGNLRRREHVTALDDAAVADVRSQFDKLLLAFARLKNPNEAETEKELIWPLLEALGWTDMSVQQNLPLKARDDVPDALLFGSAEAKANAAPFAPWQRFQHGLCIVEAKRWNRLLDREEPRKGKEGVPSTQMLRYLRRVDDVTNGGLRWGILTNGRHWQLYFRGALSIAEDFLEIDLGKICGLKGCEPDLLDKRPEVFSSDDAWHAHIFKLFILLFGRAAFLPDHRGESFLHLALHEGRQWEARVTRRTSPRRCSIACSRCFANLSLLLMDILRRSSPEPPSMKYARAR